MSERNRPLTVVFSIISNQQLIEVEFNIYDIVLFRTFWSEVRLDAGILESILLTLAVLMSRESISGRILTTRLLYRMENI